MDKAIYVSGTSDGNNPPCAAKDGGFIDLREADVFYREEELLRLAKKRVKTNGTS